MTWGVSCTCVKSLQRNFANFEEFFFSLFHLPGRGCEFKARMDQASGGEDPNKPSKKKSSEDEGKNKKLVGVRAGFSVFREAGLQGSAIL